MIGVPWALWAGQSAVAGRERAMVALVARKAPVTAARVAAQAARERRVAQAAKRGWAVVKVAPVVRAAAKTEVSSGGWGGVRGVGVRVAEVKGRP